jgi:hypothetical protein
MFQPTHIVVVESGWVFAVDCPDVQLGQHIEARQAKVIRKWGTSDGLAQLAIQGPTPNTELEPCSLVSVPAGKVLIIMVVSSAGWGD